MPLRLILRNLLGHPLRSGLTTGSVVIAVFLLCLLRTIVGALTTTIDQASAKRLMVQSAVSLYVDLPLSYAAKIAAVPGVEWICRWQYFGGIYRDESGFFSQFAVDPETFLKSYPELEIIDGSYEKFAAERASCIIGTDLADRYGWKVGDRVPLFGTIFPRAGDQAWEFTVHGIYKSNSLSFDQMQLFFHFEYLRESLEAGDATGPDGCGIFMIKPADGVDPTELMSEVDSLFYNGPQRVLTTTEREFQRQFIGMLGNIPALLTMIGAAVLFAIFVAVLNTMLMAARERTRDVGILKALGFSDRAILGTLVTEGLLVCGLGGLIGLGLALMSQSSLGLILLTMGIPGFEIDATTAGLGLGVALLVGLISGLLPGWRVSRLLPVRALQGGS